MDEKIRQSLEQLHAELEQTQSIDPATRELLEHLRKDIQAALQDPSPASPRRYNALSQRLTAALKQLEEAHPNLVLTIGQVLDHFAQV